MNQVQHGRPSPIFGPIAQQLELYLWNELEKGVGVERADGQRNEVEQQTLVKGFLHEGHHAGPRQRAQRDERHAQEPVAPH